MSDQPVSAPARSKDTAAPASTDAPRPSGLAGAPAAAPVTSSSSKRPSSPRIVVAPRGESTATRTAPTALVDAAPRAARSSEKPRSVPPPLPPVTPNKPKDTVLEAEIDASLDNLELGPTGTSLPDAPSLAQSGETLARDEGPSTVDALSASEGGRPPVTFNLGSDESTQSAQVVPHTIRDSVRAALEPSVTERPLLEGELGADSFHPPPVTVPGGPDTNSDPSATGESPITHEEMGSGDLVDFDEPTGTGIEIEHVLESTHANAKAKAGGATHDEDEIVIADDLAEDLEDDAAKGPREGDAEEEHTDAGAPLPPFRSGS